MPWRRAYAAQLPSIKGDPPVTEEFAATSVSATPAVEDGALFVVNGPALTTSEWSQVLVAVAAVLFCLQWGKGFFVPLLLGILISYSLRIPVRFLEKMRIPRLLGAACVLGLVTVLIASAGYSLRDDALVLVDQLPGAAQVVRCLSGVIADCRRVG